MPFPSSKKVKNTTIKDFEKVRAWEYAESWNNPFGSEESPIPVVDDDDGDDADVEEKRRHRRQKKPSSSSSSKKKKKRKKKISLEESSQADSLLSSILSESELEDVERFNNKKNQMPAVKEVADANAVDDESEDDDLNEDDEDCDSLNVLASVARPYKQLPPLSAALLTRSRRERPAPLSPKQVLSFDDEELLRAAANAQKSHRLADDSLHVHASIRRSDSSSLEDDEVDHGGRGGDKKEDTTVAAVVIDEEDEDDDATSNILNPFNGMDDLIKTKPSVDGSGSGSITTDKKSPKTSNPFEEDTIADNDGDEADSVATDEDNMHIEATLQEERGVIEISPRNSKSHDESEDEEEDEEEPEEEEEDIVESSKRLLRMCDERIQYQHHNEEVQTLKATVNQMKNQAEAMAEQLRRAVETKCDLVLAQNEMERRHEQVLISKDEELKEMRLYIQEILEIQAKSELNFMNEISSLARKLEIVEEKRLKENKQKDKEIVELESKVKDFQTGSLRSNLSPRSFRHRFTDSSSSIGSHFTNSKQSMTVVQR